MAGRKSNLTFQHFPLILEIHSLAVIRSPVFLIVRIRAVSAVLYQPGREGELLIVLSQFSMRGEGAGVNSQARQDHVDVHVQ